MLDTGIDVLEVVNLVFFCWCARRGFGRCSAVVRACVPDLFGPGKHKEEVVAFDHARTSSNFSQNIPATEGALGERLVGQSGCRWRLGWIGELDKVVADRQTARETTASPAGHPVSDDEVRAQIAARCCRSGVGQHEPRQLRVQPTAAHREQYAKPEAWTLLSPEALSELSHQVAGLPSQLDPENEEANSLRPGWC